MKKSLIGILIFSSLFSTVQAYDTLNVVSNNESADPTIVYCGKIHQLKQDPNSPGDLVVEFKNVRTGFLGTKLKKSKKGKKVINVTGHDNQEIYKKSILVKARLLGEQMMNKEVCILTEEASAYNNFHSSLKITSAYKLKDALNDMDNLCNTVTKL